MITIRNLDSCHSRTVIAAAQLEIGQFVKLVQAAVKGDPCRVQAVVEADLTDPTAVIGVVSFIRMDDENATDYIVDPITSTLTRNTGTDNTYIIPAGELCSFWYGKPVIGFHQEDVDAGFTISGAREGQAVAIDTTTAKLGDYDSAQADRDVVVGIIYECDGPEITVLLTAI